MWHYTLGLCRYGDYSLKFFYIAWIYSRAFVSFLQHNENSEKYNFKPTLKNSKSPGLICGIIRYDAWIFAFKEIAAEINIKRNITATPCV